MALNDTPNKLESVWVQRNTGNQFYEQINISGSDLIVYHDENGVLQADKIPVFLAKYGAGGTALSASWASQSLSASYMYFDGNRPITRDDPDFQGVNVGTDTVVDFLDKFFFPFNPATISINGGVTYYETGSSQNVSIYGSVTANSETVFGSGSVRRSGYDWYTFLSASSYSVMDLGVTGSRIYRTYMQVGNNGSPTLIYSSIKSVSFIYPYLWAVSSVAGLSGVALYQAMTTKSIQVQSTQHPNLHGTAVYIYFCFPSNYSDLASAKDQNGYEYLASIPSSFEYSASVPVTSSGLSTDWMRKYKVYRTKTHANPGGVWTFTHS